MNKKIKSINTDKKITKICERLKKKTIRDKMYQGTVITGYVIHEDTCCYLVTATMCVLVWVCVCVRKCVCVCESVSLKHVEREIKWITWSLMTYLSVHSDHEEHLPPVVQCVQDWHWASSEWTNAAPHAVQSQAVRDHAVIQTCQRCLHRRR